MLWTEPWAPARGEQGGQAPTLEKIRVGHLEILSVECERSFSVLCRLKTWLRRTTGQSRLNHELILVAHSAKPVDLDGVTEDFVHVNDQRKDDFGL